MFYCILATNSCVWEGVGGNKALEVSISRISCTLHTNMALRRPDWYAFFLSTGVDKILTLNSFPKADLVNCIPKVTRT